MAISMLQFSDVLCVYAYIAQARVKELEKTFPGQLGLAFHFCQVFDDTERKIGEGWSDRGGFEGYADHVASVVASYDHVLLHPDAWRRVRPRTSLSAHLLLHAVGALEAGGELAPGSMERTMEATRAAFFEQGRDISRQSELMAVAEELDLSRAAVERTLDSGEAQAALARDFTLSRKLNVRVSPTMIFNDGRQRLEGNVGFRIIEANVRELLRAPEHEASWC
jgi:predicted DsbA family dithiol-disulfide isomerase